jgi:hypothetical protein
MATVDPQFDAVYMSHRFLKRLGIPEDSIGSSATESRIVVDGKKSGSIGSVHLAWRPIRTTHGSEPTSTTTTTMTIFEISAHPRPPFDILCGPRFLEGNEES